MDNNFKPDFGARPNMQNSPELKTKGVQKSPITEPKSGVEERIEKVLKEIKEKHKDDPISHL